MLLAIILSKSFYKFKGSILEINPFDMFAIGANLSSFQWVYTKEIIDIDIPLSLALFPTLL